MDKNMDDFHPTAQSATCQAQLENALAGFSIQNKEHFFGLVYLPTDFKEPEQQQFMCITTGTANSKKFYSSPVGFWVHALFDFLEDQLNDEKFEAQALSAECEPIDEK